MGNKWIAVNLALLGIVGLLAWQLLVAVERFKADNDLGKLKSVGSLKQRVASDSGGLPAPQSRKPYNAADFGVIPAQNLFSDVRGKPEEDPKAAVNEAPPLQIKPILVGVTVSGGQRLASIIDPTAGQGVRRSQTRRIGDNFQGYTIVEISDTQLVLENGSRREIIPLYDTTKQRTGGGKTPILSTRVVNFGPGGGGGAAAPVVSAGAPRPGQAPAAQPAGAGQQPASVNAQPSVRTTIPPPQTRQTPSTGPQPTWNERTDDQGRKVIRTPFGDIIRDKPPSP